MSLSLGTGPLAGEPAGAFNFDLSEAPAHRIFFADYPRRLRAVAGNRVVLDTTRAKLLFETGIPPVPYVPLEDFDQSLLERTDHSTHCPFKGDASYWTVRAGDRVVENAVWAYEDPLPDATWLRGYGALYWKKADEWFVEEEPGRTRVELEHRDLQNFGEHAEQMKNVFEAPDAWTQTLANYVSAARTAA